VTDSPPEDAPADPRDALIREQAERIGAQASLAADAVRLIRTLITAAAVAGFDETTLRSGPAGEKRSGPAGEKKYVHGVFTEEYSAFWLGARSLDSMQDAGILPDFAGIVVSDRYQNYFHLMTGNPWRPPGQAFSP
jgi:hypothetical protein